MNYMTEYISGLLDGDTNKTMERAKIIFSKKWNDFMTRYRRMKYLREESDRLLQEGFRISAIYGRSLQVFNAYAARYKERFVEHAKAAIDQSENLTKLSEIISKSIFLKFYAMNEVLTEAYQSGKINQRKYYNTQYSLFFDILYYAEDTYDVGGSMFVNNALKLMPQTNNSIVNYKMRELIQNEVDSFLAKRK